jgi:DNA-nicking Smr family endonuclease
VRTVRLQRHGGAYSHPRSKRHFSTKHPVMRVPYPQSRGAVVLSKRPEFGTGPPAEERVRRGKRPEQIQVDLHDGQRTSSARSALTGLKKKQRLFMRGSRRSRQGK